MDSSQQPTNAFDDLNSTPSQPEAEQAQPPAPDSPASTPLEIESETSEIEAEQAQPPAPDFASEAQPVATPELESEPETEPFALSEPDFKPEMADFDDSDLDSPWDAPEATAMPPQQPTVQSENLPVSEAQVPAKSMNSGLLINRIVAIAIFIYGAIAVISLLN
ncbi:MAG: hypothetical protein ACLFV6_18655 [Spirulinaceae cyanobacterium]